MLQGFGRAAKRKTRRTHHCRNLPVSGLASSNFESGAPEIRISSSVVSLIGGSGICVTVFPAATFAEYPSPGTGTRCLIQTFFSPTSEIPRVTAIFVMGCAQTDSYRVCRVSVARHSHRFPMFCLSPKSTVEVNPLRGLNSFDRADLMALIIGLAFFQRCDRILGHPAIPDVVAFTVVPVAFLIG